MVNQKVKPGRKVRVVKGGLVGAEGVVSEVEAGVDPAARIILTKGDKSGTYRPGRTIGLFTWKLEIIGNGVDPNFEFSKRKHLNRQKPFEPFLFRCKPCGWQSPNNVECPECGRHRTCYACGHQDFSKGGQCQYCGSTFRQPY